MSSFGFIMTRHVNSETTNRYWNHSVKLLRSLYPNERIVIIDDNSNKEFLKAEFPYNNVMIIQSDYPGRGELLPYYYYIRDKFFDNAVIIHDSVFFHKRINFQKLQGVKVLPLWFFHSDSENIKNTLKISSCLRNYQTLHNKMTNENVIKMQSDKWSGCFGVQTYINHNFLLAIENKYEISNMISHVLCRADRCCLERIMGCIFSSECPALMNRKSLFGDIMTYQKWGETFDKYLNNLKQKKKIKTVVKVWSGR